MKPAFFVAILIVMTIPGRSQCVYEHEGSFIGTSCDYPSPFISSIEASDSVTFSLFNFLGQPSYLGLNEIQAKMDCINDSVHVIPKWFTMYNGDVLEFYGDGLFNDDTLIINYINIVFYVFLKQKQKLLKIL